MKTQLKLVCSVVCVYVCVFVCVLITIVSLAKTAKPIEMPFGGLIHWAQATVYQMRSRSDESIRLSEGAAFVEIILTIC